MMKRRTTALLTLFSCYQATTVQCTTYSILKTPITLRGGSTQAATSVTTKPYLIQQKLLLQQRSNQLQQALLARGLPLTVEVSSNTPVKVDWDCALSTERHPKSCLYSFDALAGSKVIAPAVVEGPERPWITLTAWNRLRRTDPTKIAPLWHSQYDWTAWIHGRYSLYNHLPWYGTLLALVLDHSMLLMAFLWTVLILALGITLPIWETVLTSVLTSNALWLQWPNWGRFVHAALPLKLLLGQMAWKAVAVAFGHLYQSVRHVLVEWECTILQDCIPLTIVEEEDDDDM